MVLMEAPGSPRVPEARVPNLRPSPVGATDGGVFEPPQQPARPLRPLRLALGPVLGWGSADGAWWPWSLSPEREVGQLLTALAPRLGRSVRGLSLDGSAWPRRSLRQPATGPPDRLGHFVRLEPLIVDVAPVDPADVVSNVPFRGSRVRLLVIPPDTDAALAASVLAYAASGVFSYSGGLAGVLAAGTRLRPAPLHARRG
jgi:hypothetical protein